MSSVIVIAPVVVANWSVISATVAAASGALGFTAARGVGSCAHRAPTQLVLELPDSEIEHTTADQPPITVERDGVMARFERRGSGKLTLCLSSATHTREQLGQLGQQLLGAVTQQYVYHRIVTELKSRRMAIVAQQMQNDRSVRIRVRESA